MTKPITSLQNQRLKDAVKLRDRRARQRQRRIIIDGARELRQAVEAGVAMVEVFVCDELCEGEDAQAALRLIRQSGAELLPVTAAVFAKLAFGDRAEGVIGVARTPEMMPADLPLGDNPLVAVIESIEKPGNVGAVIRSADGAGVSAVVVADPTTDLYNPNAIRASLGTIFTMPVCEATGEETLCWLRERQLKTFAARVDGAVAHTEADYTQPTAIILGSEAAGLSPVWRAEDVTAVRLPMLGTADSLNISVAAAVLFYEALRQRTERVPRG